MFSFYNNKSKNNSTNLFENVFINFQKPIVFLDNDCKIIFYNNLFKSNIENNNGIEISEIDLLNLFCIKDTEYFKKQINLLYANDDFIFKSELTSKLNKKTYEGTFNCMKDSNNNKIIVCILEDIVLFNGENFLKETKLEVFENIILNKDIEESINILKNKIQEETPFEFKVFIKSNNEEYIFSSEKYDKYISHPDFKNTIVSIPIFDHPNNVVGGVDFIDVFKSQSDDTFMKEFSDLILKLFSNHNKKLNDDFLISHDSLTGLFNRRIMIPKFSYLKKKLDKSKEEIAICFLDFDKFKDINDNLGHKIGDMFLREISNKLSKNFSNDNEFLFRYGGDEFIIISKLGIQENNESLLINKINEIFDEPINIEGNKIKISSSIGISFYPNDSDDLDSLLKTADDKMYNNKKMNSNNL